MAQTRTVPPRGQQQANNQQQSAPPRNDVVVMPPPRLSAPPEDVLVAYEVDKQGWRTLVESIFPAAKTHNAVIMALDYCKRRKLDIFKHPVHIVSVYSTAAGGFVETIWPGISELRTTAMRTGQYAGLDIPAFGPMVERTFTGKVKEKKQDGGEQMVEKSVTVEFPEWCQITVYRTLGSNRVPFPGPRVNWLETYARLNNFVEIPNSMWQKRANGQLEKCAEAAALRRAFPEELGSDYSIDEIGAYTTHAPTDVTDDVTVTTAPAAEPKPDDPKYTKKTKEKAASPDSAKTGAQGGAGQPGGKAAEAPSATSGPPGKKATDKPVTDVVDQNDKAREAPVFTDYKRFGDFFIFADPWVSDPIRNEAELTAFAAFYEEYSLKGLAHAPDKVASAFKDTKKMLDDGLRRFEPPPREPGEDG